MTDENDQSDITAAVAGKHRDRSLGLTIFGFLQLMVSGACLLKAATVLMTPASPGSTRALAGVCAGAGVFFGVVGAGSIFARRWARAIMLVGASIWAVAGTLLFAVLLRGGHRIVPRLQAWAGLQADAATASAAWVVIVIAGFSLLVLMPALTILFYRSPNVKATVERRDPKPRWTDRVPLPVLGMSGLFSVGSISWVAALASRWITGVPAIVVSILAAVLLLLIAWGIFRLKRSAWWMALAFGVAGPVLGWLGINSIDWIETWSKLGLTEQDIEAQQFNSWAPGTVTAFGGAVSALFLAHLFWIGRHFKAPGDVERDGTTAQARPGTDAIAR